jgi:GH25 family lysozyme M1 (1,4-beta-N-acetylmuramidase)
MGTDWPKLLGAALAGAGVLAVTSAAFGQDSARNPHAPPGTGAGPFPPYSSGAGFLDGVDVSAAQGNAVDWKAAKDDAHLSFMIAKEGQGVPGKPRGFQLDGSFVHNRDAARAIFPFWGAYRYVIFSQDARLTVQSMARNIEAFNNGGMLPPAFDFEWQYNDGKVPETGGPPSGAQVLDWMSDCADECKRILSRRPMVYTSSGWWNSIGDPRHPIQDAFALWVANWTAAPQPSVPKGWTKYSLWQWSAQSGPLANHPIKGIPGKSVDRNRFPGTLEDMGAFVRASIL